jgi:PST family polysaccharide transporter/lipopolysaccharide exporter
VFRARTAQNVAIVVGLNWFNQLLQIASKIILARLLFPNDFGIFALAGGLVSLVTTFGSVGLNYAIIQKSDRATREDYDVGMTLRLLISLVLLGITLAVAGPWAALFREPAVVPTTEVLAILYLVTPWSFVPSTKLTADLRYKAQILPSLAGQIGYAAVAIGLAFAGFGVWALVLGTILGQAASVIGYMLAAPWRFRLSLRWKVARPLLVYSQHLLTAAVLAFLMVNLDDFAVGFLLGTTALGFYAVATGLGYIPMSLISGPVGSALFPSLTKLQGDPETLRSAYLEGFGYAVAVIAPAAIGIAVIAPELVRIALGPTWLPSTVALLVLAFYGLFRSFIDFSASLFAAVGKPRIVAELNLIVVLASAALLFPLTEAWGIEGTAVAMTLPVVGVFALSLRATGRVLGTTTGAVLRRATASLLAAQAMGVIVFGVRMGLYSFLPPRIYVVGGLSMAAATLVFLIALPVGIASYSLILRVIDRELFDGFWRNFGIAFRPKTAQLVSELR